MCGPRQGLTGKEATMDANLSSNTTTGVAPGDDEGNPNKGGPPHLPCPGPTTAKVHRPRSIFGGEGGEAVVGSDNGDGGCLKSFAACFSSLGCPRKRPGTSPVGFLDPTIKLKRTDLGGCHGQIRPEGERDRGGRARPGGGATRVRRRGGREEGSRKKRARAVAAVGKP
jgi:hypothetical protein